MNEERPIEKLLRRYAKKRRDVTPESPGLEMHPATRRLLQGEMKRQFAKNAAQEKSATPFWKIWGPRLIWALPVLLVLVVGVWALIGPDKKNVAGFDLAKNDSLSAPAEMAKRSPMPDALPSDDSKLLAAATATPSPLAAAAPALALNESSVAYSDSARAEEPVNQPLGLLAKSVELDRNRKLDDESLKLKATSTLALPPQLEGSDRESRQKTARTRATVEEVAAVTRADKLETLSRGGGGGAAPSAAPATVNTDGFGTVQAFKQNFDQLSVNTRYATVANAGGVSPVLTNFQVEQNGNELRVIDSDGSTYAGSVELAGVDKDSRAAGEFKEKSHALQQDYRRSLQPTGAATGDKAQAGQLYFFRVAGTNLTLQQSVIFAGNFVTLTNLPAKTLTVTSGLAGEAQPARGQTASPALFNSSINGRAQLGAGREFEINAMPVKP